MELCKKLRDDIVRARCIKQKRKELDNEYNVLVLQLKEKGISEIEILTFENAA
ncbi:MAG: hypothetical protein MK137_04430 [Rickettsiales bacterium]|nr:hypothetical protein [Rickettsiales bacterium]